MARDEEQEQSNPVKTASIAGYNSAVQRFSQSVTALMEQMHHLREARDSYNQAITASAELRKLLDASDERLVHLMCQLEQAIDVQLGRQTSEKKKPESLKIEAINGKGDGTDISKASA